MREAVYVFDLDDTLYLEANYVRSGFNHIGRVIAERYSVGGAATYAWDLFTEGVRGNTFDRVVEYFSLPSDLVPDLISEYRNHVPSIRLEADALEFLSTLPAHVVGTGMITDGYGPGQWNKIDALGVRGMIDQIVVTNDHGPDWTKPSENAFRWIEEQFNDRDLSFVYFADNPHKDFQAPTKRGWQSVRIRRPSGLHHDTPDIVPVHYTSWGFSSLTMARHGQSSAPQSREGIIA